MTFKQIVLFCASLCLVNCSVRVKLPSATVIGRDDSAVNGIQVESFLGIPFGEYLGPQIDRRFSRASLVQSTGEVNATAFHPMCFQRSSSSMSEDCLYLNIFRKKDDVSKKLKPVIVIIHGGGFSAGSAAAEAGGAKELAALGDVITVSVSYRLGILGFADLGEPEKIEANLGLYDQVLGLVYVRKYIQYFGGDPKQVTVMGASAGSISVSALVASPQVRKRGLFQNVVMDAGVVCTGTAVPSSVSANRLHQIVQELHCDPKDDDVQCLRKQDAKLLCDLSFDPVNYNPMRTFQPSFDGDFLPKDMEEDVQTNASSYANVRMLIGNSRDEGSIFAGGTPRSIIPPLKNEQEFIAWTSKLAHWYQYPINMNKTSVQNSVISTYWNQYQPSSVAVTRFVGDGNYICATNAFLKSFTKSHQNVYVYHFERLFRKAYFGVDPKIFGVYHTTPYMHYTGAVVNVPDADAMDVEFSLDFLKTVIDFVKGKAPSLRGVQWPDYSKTGEVLWINETPVVKSVFPNEENCKNVFPHYLNP